MFCYKSTAVKIGIKMKLIIFLLGFVTLVSCQYEYEEPLLYDTFPDDFFFGVATSAFQVLHDMHYAATTGLGYKRRSPN